jgi:hypothetical protein
MLAKIIVGVVAALLVTGTGVYFAYSDSCGHKCSGTADVAPSDDSCCAKTPPKPCCDGHDEEECSESKACTADAAGAFVGGAALTAKSGCKKGCCDE